MTDFVFFWRNGETSFLSQWKTSPYILDGTCFCSVEQGLMFEKAMMFRDAEASADILKTKNPKVIKSIGRKVKNFDEKRWQEVRENISLRHNLAKFEQNSDLGLKLLSTGDKILAEASPYDQIWGIGLSESDPRARNTELWRGENILGKVLMKTRALLRS